MITERGKEVRKMKLMWYKVRQLANGKYGIYKCTACSEILVKTCKTERAANNWVSWHAEMVG